ncbi:MAG: glycosyltransferase family 4 protein [Porphyromonadaceae bacterium]|nr:glycosyltransferase family 4 protein [Porphyromonadaceae bacterium]
MKKVLIITYYWIPSGGAGVQRWVKFVKYLREFGWEPVVYTPENPEYPSEDYSFEKDIPQNTEVIKTPIWEPYDIYRNLTGKKGKRINAGFISENKKSDWKDKLSIWLRGNFLIPDPRKFWIKPSVKFLTMYIKENQIDAVISTGPPHSMHMIGLGLKKIFPNLIWFADFRDPWTNIDFYKDLNLTRLADRIHHKMERKVIQTADNVIVVSNEMVNEFSLFNPKKITLITNGFDSDDVSDVNVGPDKHFTLSHIGTLNSDRNPKALWKVLKQICENDTDFKERLEIRLIGKTDFSVLEEIKNNGLIKNLVKVDYLSHNEAIVRQKSSQLLLLLINNSANAKGILTGKFFEYLASGRPILAIGPTDGDVAKILKETNSGKIIDFEDEAMLKQVILEYYKLYKNGNLKAETRSIEKYSRKVLTQTLASLLDDTIK